MPCVFCSYPKTTNEHVFPQWVLDVLPGEGRVVHRWEAPPRSDGESREWTADVITFTANVVCSKNCNSGWMSRLETDARPYLEPMIQGRGRTLYGRGRELVAFWALKTAMMIDFAQEETNRSVPLDDYPALYAAQTVLPSTFVWLAGSDFGAGALAQHRTLDIRSGDHHAAGYGATVNVGHLVIQVIRADLGGGRAIDIVGRLGPALQRLWPAPRPVIWPPKVLLTRQHVAMLGQMIEANPTTLGPI